MRGRWPAWSGPATVLVLGVLLVEVVVIAVLVRGSGAPRRVPVSVVAPPIVARALADRVSASDGDRLVVSPAPDEAVARRRLEAGTSVAAVVVDLRGTRDRLLLEPVRDDRLNAAVTRHIVAVERGFGRTVDVERLTEPAARSTALPRLYRLDLAAALTGFMFVVALTVWRGPVARTLRRGAGRVAGAVVIAAVAAPALTRAPLTAVPDHAGAAAAVVGLLVLVSALLVMGLEALAGLAGLALAAGSFAVLSAPLLLHTDPYLQPRAWSSVTPWTPSGAALEALSQVTLLGPAGAVRPVLVLVVWTVVGVLTLLLARRARFRLGLGVVSRPDGSARGSRPWRLSVALVVVPTSALLLAAVALVPAGSVPAVAVPGTASGTACVATGRLDTVADLNRVAGRLRSGPEFQGGDVGADVRLQDGRRLWVFGDTLRSATFEGQRFVRNSMLVVAPGCLQVVLPHDHGALIPDRSDGVGYWPMSIGKVQRPGYDLVSVGAQRVRSTGSGPFDFENLGPAQAVFVVPRGGTPQLIAQRDIGPDSADRGRPTWGAAAAVQDGWVYLYGTANPGQDAVFGFSLRVARVRPDDLLEPDRWRYWDGRGWVADPRDAAELIGAAGGVSQTLSVFRRGDRWYALSKRDDFLGNDLTVWTAPTPHGPFTAGTTLASLPSDTARGELRYMPLAHPDLLPMPGSVVVSYSRNNTDTGAVQRDPLLYRPRFVRVPLP